MEMSDRIAIFQRVRETHRPIDDRVRRIYQDKAAWTARESVLKAKIDAHYSELGNLPKIEQSWYRLLNHLGYSSPLLSISPVVPSLGPTPGNTSLDALIMLAFRSDQWIRPIEEWPMPEGDALDQIGSLARHLLTRYFVPKFLDAAWFEGFTLDSLRHQDWFVHIGMGGNIRRAELPLRLTERAAHWFLQAPADSSIVGALRYGQVRGMGGDSHLAAAAAESAMRQILPDEPFWESVLHFFVNHPAMGLSQIGPVVDYLYAQKFGSGEPAGAIADALFDDAPEPGLTMKGRTVPALLRRIDEWHERLAREMKRPKSVWEPSGITPLCVEQPDSYKVPHQWVVRELLNSRELMEEGREQRHCVFSYGANCLNGSCSIWSLRVRSRSDARFRRLFTIEVNNARRAIVQVRGRCNKSVGALARGERMRTAAEMLRRWAREARLSIACSL
jgi:hypothetical protein